MVFRDRTIMAQEEAGRNMLIISLCFMFMLLQNKKENICTHACNLDKFDLDIFPAPELRVHRSGRNANSKKHQRQQHCDTATSSVVFKFLIVILLFLHMTQPLWRFN